MIKDNTLKCLISTEIPSEVVIELHSDSQITFELNWLTFLQLYTHYLQSPFSSVRYCYIKLKFQTLSALNVKQINLKSSLGLSSIKTIQFLSHWHFLRITFIRNMSFIYLTVALSLFRTLRPQLFSHFEKTSMAI